jgi:hypothetical protein
VRTVRIQADLQAEQDLLLVYRKGMGRSNHQRYEHSVMLGESRHMRAIQNDIGVIDFRDTSDELDTYMEYYLWDETGIGFPHPEEPWFYVPLCWEPVSARVVTR